MYIALIEKNQVFNTPQLWCIEILLILYFYLFDFCLTYIGIVDSPSILMWHPFRGLVRMLRLHRDCQQKQTLFGPIFVFLPGRFP